jgi:hypothetical protein
MEQLREFLRHQYIGAIVIGLLACQGVMALISAFTSSLSVAVIRMQAHTSAFEHPEAYPWDQLLPSVTQAVLCLGLAYLMLQWLYGSRREPVEEQEPAESGE